MSISRLYLHSCIALLTRDQTATGQTSVYGVRDENKSKRDEVLRPFLRSLETDPSKRLDVEDLHVDPVTLFHVGTFPVHRGDFVEVSSTVTVKDSPDVLRTRTRTARLNAQSSQGAGIVQSLYVVSFHSRALLKGFTSDDIFCLNSVCVHV